MKKNILTLILIITIGFSYSQVICVPDAYTLNDTITCNDSAMIILGEVGGGEDFSCGGPCNPGWSSVGTQYDEPYIPSPDGNGYMWMGPATTQPRQFVSPTFNATCGGTICFDFVMAVQGTPSPIEGPDLSEEGISLQYSLNNGTTWVDIVYFMPNGQELPSNPGPGFPMNPPFNSSGTPYTVWNSVCKPIPLAAQVSNVKFRWYQQAGSSNDFDHWGLDNVQVSINSDLMDAILLSTGVTYTVPPSDTFFVHPTNDSMFIFFFNNLAYQSNPLLQYTGFDTVYVYIEETDAGPDMIVSCSTQGRELSVSGVMPYSNVVWSPILGLDTPNIQNPYANPIDDQMYTVTSDCGVDSILVDVVPIFDIFTNSPNDSICVNDVATLVGTATPPEMAGVTEYTYQWTNFVADDTSATTNVMPTINTMYYLEMVSDSGCIRNDSIMIYVGAVPKTILYDGEQRVCAGDSTQITVTAIQPTFFDDFDVSGGANMNIWSDIQNGTANTDCGSISGNALHFNGGLPNRWAQLIPVDASLGGTISFDLIYGSGAAPCAFVGFLDDMILEYSIDNGVTWTTMITYNGNYNNWTHISDTIVAGAQTANTIFRFNQPSYGGNNQDNWAMDNFLLELNCAGATCVNYSYNWSPTATVSDPTSLNPYFFPSITTTYALSISPEGFNCNSAADSITISVDELNITINPSDSFLCEPTTLLLEAEIDGFSSTFDGVYIVNPSSGAMLSGAATNVSLGDDQTSAAIPIPFAFDFFGNSYSSFSISSNGFISFTPAGSGCCSGQVLPNTTNPNDVVALLWSDLDPGGGAGTISYFVTGVAPNRVQVIEFMGVPHYPGLPGPTVSGQIQLYETSNIVEIVCLDCQTDNGSAQTMGIENATGTLGWAPPAFNGVPGWTSSLVAGNGSWSFIPSNSPALFSYEWSPNYEINDISISNPLVSPLVSTDYVFSVTNINNCLFTDTAEIELFGSNTTLTANPNPSCKGETIQLNATGADTYTWIGPDLNDNNIPNPVSSTTVDNTMYYVTYETQGCTSEDSIQLDIRDLPVLDINNATNPVNLCEGETVDLFVDNLSGWSYNWQGTTNSTNSLTVSSGGNYVVSFNDGYCDNTAQVTVAENPKPTLDFSSFTDTILCCKNDETTINFTDYYNNAINIQTTMWNGVVVNDNSYTYMSEDASLDGNATELNFIELVSDKNCSSGKIYLPKVHTKCSNPYFVGPDTIFSNTSDVFDLSVDENGATNSYLWTTTDPASGAISDATVEDVQVNATDESTPTYEMSVQVTSQFENGKECPAEVAETKTYTVLDLSDPMYPDAFTPNGDDLNNLFKPVINQFAEITEFRIYNRWGDLVYDMATAENKDGWDGKWKGVDQKTDVYTYYITVKHPDKDFVKEGSFTLLR